MAAPQDDHRRWWVWHRGERAVAWLSHLRAATVFIGFLLWFGGWTILVGVVVELALDGGQEDEIATAAGRLMPAFGILFAFLTGFVISNQWNRSREAEATAGHESDACLRLALASQSHGLDGRRIRAQLTAYLQAVLEVKMDPSIRGSPTRRVVGHRRGAQFATPTGAGRPSRGDEPQRASCSDVRRARCSTRACRRSARPPCPDGPWSPGASVPLGARQRSRLVPERDRRGGWDPRAGECGVGGARRAGCARPCADRGDQRSVPGAHAGRAGSSRGGVCRPSIRTLRTHRRHERTERWRGHAAQGC